MSEATGLPPDGAPTPTPAAAEDDLLALPHGHELHEYRFERVLGGGGFGITYLARDTHLDCAVAIKEYLPRDSAVRGPDLSLRPRHAEAAKSFEWGLQRFLEESRALANFHHAGIVRVLRYFRANNTAYMVMEYETGEPLQRWLLGRGRLDRARLVRIVRPLLDGLEVIHKAGFLHRDIKPGNIYMRADGSPVLLDFGSARRVDGDDPGQALTAVVSPGFAPAEQYHRHGKQGPWTDIYSLAAVMYWMVTGRLPVEAFARLKEDIMPSAREIGNEAVFGAPLLRAIDWALDPDESRRPRQVADFRRAFLAGAAEDGAPAGGQDAAAAMIAERGTVICAALFVDVAEPTAALPDARSRLAHMVGQALAPIPATSRIALNTSEGCAVCYVGDPEDALRAAVALGKGAVGQGLALRIGINLGPVQVVPSAEGRSRVTGDGIATALRVMRFCEPGQVLVARAYYEVILHIKQGAASCFHRLGLRRDKQEREHDLYLFSSDALVTGSNAADPSLARPVAGSDISQEGIDTAERLLAQHMGPMARILVRKAVPRAHSLAELHQQLAALIPDPAPRTGFLSALQGTLLPATATPSRAPSATVSSSRPVTGQTPGVLPEDALAAVEKRLARHIGPMARVLVRRESRNAATLETLCRALAAHIDKDADRQRFLAESGLG